MYEIEQASFGYDLTFSGFMDADEMTKWKKTPRTLCRILPTRTAYSSTCET